ncbi:hypothetical protein [Bacillus sp. 2205SS5-2]|uniref:hypothetical protein n=1 Tax=Bacillus sp. 2205SS5-2 TaxID=3109031 RepID=UPI003005E5B5
MPESLATVAGSRKAKVAALRRQVYGSALLITTTLTNDLIFNKKEKTHANSALSFLFLSIRFELIQQKNYVLSKHASKAFN